MTNNNLEERLQQQNISLAERVTQGIKNWAIDTSAKVGFYAPLMATMEAYNGLEGEQILQSRIAAAAVDVGVARIYTKTADYLAQKYDIDLKEDNFKAWAVDTVAMVSTYMPIYAAILASTGADLKQIGTASVMGAGIAVVTSRPFRKYVLTPWRKLCGFKEAVKIDQVEGLQQVKKIKIVEEVKQDEETKKVEANQENPSDNGYLNGGWW